MPFVFSAFARSGYVDERTLQSSCQGPKKDFFKSSFLGFVFPLFSALYERIVSLGRALLRKKIKNICPAPPAEFPPQNPLVENEIIIYNVILYFI